MKKLLQKFEISFGIHSKLYKAKDFDDLIDNRIHQGDFHHFQAITFIDEHDRIFSIDRETFDAWTRTKCLQDCTAHQDELEFLRDDHKLFLEREKSRS